MKKHLNIFFPEWQGYGEDNTVQTGARILKNHFSKMEFAEIDVADEEALLTANNIMGYEANLRHLKHAVDLLTTVSPSSTFMIGGTCATEIGPVSYLNNYYNGDLAVLWFDAHGDLNTPESSGSKHFHGMPLRSLLGDGEANVSELMFSRLQPKQVFVLGGRDLDEPELSYIVDSEIRLFTPEKLQDITHCIDSIKKAGFQHLYIHVDLDVLEPEDFPHMLLPVEKGVTVDHLFQLLEQLREVFQIVGVSVVEYVPKDDSGLQSLERLVELIHPEKLV